MRFMSTAFKIVFGLFVVVKYLSSPSYSGDKEPMMYLNCVNSVVILQVSKCTSTCENYSCGSLGQNSSNFNKTVGADEAG